MRRRDCLFIFMTVLCIFCSSCTFFSTVSEPVGADLQGIAEQGGEELDNPVADNVEQIQNAKTELRIALCNAKELNPYTETSRITQEALRLVYEPLFSYDESMRVIPCLAESYMVSEDGRDITVKIKDNIKWHDGKNLTANDVIFTVGLLVTGENPYYDGTVSKASMLNRKTVKISFFEPQINAPEHLMFPIVKSTEGAPVGTGAFKYDGRINSDTYSFSAFSEYHGEKSQVITIKMVNCPDEVSVTRMFEVGETDILTSEAFDYSAFNVNANMNIYEYTTNELAYIGINFDNSIFWGESTRQALMYILDKNEITDKSLYKKAEPADFPVNPRSVFYNRDMGYKKNNALAEELLARDSWTRVDSVFARMEDGVRHSFKINLLVSEDETLASVAETIKQTLKNFGIECEIVRKNEEEFLTALQNKSYDIFINKARLCGSADFELLTGAGNVFGYLNSDLNALTEKMRTERDEETLKSMYSECFKIFLKDVQFIPLFFFKDAVAAGKDVSLTMLPIGRVPF